jgi:hypothetical protein
VLNSQIRLCLAITFIIVSLLLSFTSPAVADGGPFIKDAEIWAQLEEGQQTAVVAIKDDNTVDVDLFVSMMDNSGQSHEVVFFVPLGTAPMGFQVIEKTSLDFDDELIEELDEALRREAQSKRDVFVSLFSATLLTNGGWLMVLCLPLLLSGCTGYAPPEETYETDSSRVDIYGLDEDSDLEALINTTGLDPSVHETLSRLRGQRIAIVTLQTQPPLLTDDESNLYQPTGQPGIHLAWTTELTSQSGSATYSYPLGTGSSWAHPIELTRIYVVATTNTDFTVQYPRLGADYSGYSGYLDFPFILFNPFYPPKPRIMDHYDTPAYAVDETRGDFGRIWRVTYTQSNSAEDIVISMGTSSGFLTAVRRSLLGWGLLPTILLGFLIALVLWVAVWRYCMPRMLGKEYRWRDSKLWRDSLFYVGINAAGILAAVAIAGGVIYLGSLIGFLTGTVAIVFVLIIAGLVILAALFGVPSILLFVRRYGRNLGISRGRTATAYIVVALVVNSAYLALIFGYSALAGII